MAIIITLSDEQAKDINLLEKFVLGGATRFRFNSSFSSPEIINQASTSLSEVGKSFNQKIDIIIDIPGKKRRLGKLKKSILELAAGKAVNFCLGRESTDSDDIIPVPEKDFLELIEPGDLFFIKDGKIKFLITSVDENNNCFTAECLTSTRLESFLGYSLHLKKLDSPASFQADSFNLEMYDFKVINQIAVSYAESPDVLEDFEKSLLLSGHRVGSIAKIETQAGFDKLEELDKVCQEIWFCRGDFANNVSVENLFRYEKKLLEMLPRLKSPVYVAGENMLGMIHDALPSRAEIAHLGYLFDSGIDGIVLSDETVKSENPLDVFLLAQKINIKYNRSKGIQEL